MHKAIIFDFDGTIADSERTMLASLNAIASEFGFQPLESEEIPALRKLSARTFVTKRLGIPFWNLWTIVRLEKRAKEEFAKRDTSLRVFPGMADVIATLRSRGHIVGIVSSTPDAAVVRVLREAGIAVDFVHAGSPAYLKAHALRAALRTHGLTRENVLYVGDEVRDVDACRRVGIPIIAITWGLNNAETLAARGASVASTPQELLARLVR